MIISKHVDYVLSGFNSKGKTKGTGEFIFSSIFWSECYIFIFGTIFLVFKFRFGLDSPANFNGGLM